jgi:hypothetical protein
MFFQQSRIQFVIGGVPTTTRQIEASDESDKSASAVSSSDD